MTMDDQTFTAFVVRPDLNDEYSWRIETKSVRELPPGDVLIKVDYSSLNYKDALSATGNKGVTKKYPHTPGIDAAGTVAASDNSAFTAGDEVIVSGYDLGMNTPGGFGRYIRVPSSWVLPRPSGLSSLQCMQIGTAGFTAAQSVKTLIDAGLSGEAGPVLVSGATGGVGSMAIVLLKQLGFTVTAVTGKETEHAFLTGLGATDFLNRKQAALGRERMLLRTRWAGVVDTVGGEILASAIKATGYGGTVTCCGNAASGDLPLNVYPFILRAVRLVGIDSANCLLEKRKEIWQLLADRWYIPKLDEMSKTVPLADIGHWISEMLRGRIRRRIVIDLREEA